tara:strand:+ start:53400 stop:54281 length:882 start_codon:yes stop_codon:yes gene_type:complete
MNLVKRRKFLSVLVNFSLVFPASFFALVILFSPIASAQSTGSCDVPAVNNPTTSNSISLDSVEDRFWSDDTPLYDLRSDVFVDFTVDNDSATSVSMKLVPGYMYTFCISITSNQDDPPVNPSSDIYLMTEPNWDRYVIDYELRESDDFFEAFDQLPVEWRDMDDWLPFRDVHAYEDTTYVEFSVAIDSPGSGFFGGGNIAYYLVIDGWDNRRHTNADASGGDIDVEVLIDVEERLNIPKFTATLLVGSLPLACIILPMIIHMRYMANGKENIEAEERRELPYLDNENTDFRDT